MILLRLFDSSGILGLNSDKLSGLRWSEGQIKDHIRSMQIAVNVVVRIWANNYRFASEDRLRTHLKKITGYQKIKGDYLKEQARRFLNAAQQLVDKGAILWRA